MRDPFGIHRRRVRSALRTRLQPGETIDAFARDEITRDYWALTNRRLFCLRQGVVAQHIALNGVRGSVSEERLGVTIRVHSRQPADGQMLATFRADEKLTRQLARILQRPPSGSE